MANRRLARLAEVQLLPVAAAALLTVGVSERLGVRRIQLFNTDSVTRIVTISRVPDDGGGSPVAVALANQFARITMPTKTPWLLEPEFLTMQDEGQALFFVCDAASKVTASIDGVAMDDPALDRLKNENLADSQFVSNAAATIITNTVNKRRTLREITVHNATATADLFKLWRVPDSGGAVGTAADANQIWEESIPAWGQRVIKLDETIEDLNDTFQAEAASASTLVVSADGILEDLLL